MPGNVVLIGFSGSGKSAVGQLLAERLGWSFVDTDEAIVRRFGKSIAAIFREEGEAAFRAAERDVVALACADARQVISVGGGAPVDRGNRARLLDGNLVVRLEASPETILARLRAASGAEERPLLAGDDPLSRIRSLRAARVEAYAIAHHVVETEGRTPPDVAREVSEVVRGFVEAVEGTGR